jgi:hypothetical protein
MVVAAQSKSLKPSIVITSRSKWRPANRSFMPLDMLIVGPFLPNHYCNSLDLAICTRGVIGDSQIPAGYRPRSPSTLLS